MNKQLMIDSQQGATTILLAFFVMSVLLMIASGAAGIMIYQIQMSRDIADSVPAFYASDAGAERCLFQARCVELDPPSAVCLAETGAGLNDYCAGNNQPINFDLINGASVWAERKNANRLQAAGSFGTTKRQVELSW